MTGLAASFISGLSRFAVFALLLIVSSTTEAQIAAFEKHIGTINNPTINLQMESRALMNATIRTWDKDQVYIAAVSNDRPFSEENLRVTVSKDKIDIDVH